LGADRHGAAPGLLCQRLVARHDVLARPALK
jgi:hypothetical protein